MGILRYSELHRVRDLPGWTFTLEGNLQDVSQAHKLVLKMPGYLGSTLALSPPDNSGTITAQCSAKENWQTLLKKLGRHLILTAVEDTE